MKDSEKSQNEELIENVIEQFDKGDDMFNMDEVVETLRILPKTASPFNTVHISNIEFVIPDLDKNPKLKTAIQFTIEEKQPTGVATQVINISNIFKDKTGVTNGRSWDLRKSGLIRLKHIFGALTSTPIEGLGSMDLNVDDLDIPFKRLFDALMNLLDKEEKWKSLKLNMKFTMYGSYLTFPLNPPFIHSVHKNRLADIKWITGTDKDIPDATTKKATGSEGNSDSANDLPF